MKRKQKQGKKNNEENQEKKPFLVAKVRKVKKQAPERFPLLRQERETEIRIMWRLVVSEKTGKKKKARGLGGKTDQGKGKRRTGWSKADGTGIYRRLRHLMQ